MLNYDKVIQGGIRGLLEYTKLTCTVCAYPMASSYCGSLDNCAKGREIWLNQEYVSTKPEDYPD